MKKDLLDKIEQFEKLDAESDKALFREIIELSLEHLSEETFRDEFEIATSTVRRWKSGIAIPLPKMRKLIVKFIKSNL